MTASHLPSDVQTCVALQILSPQLQGDDSLMVWSGLRTSQPPVGSASSPPLGIDQLLTPFFQLLNM